MKSTWRLLFVLPVLAAAVALFVWRGPDWHVVHDAFTVVRWRWVFAAIGLNLLSVLARAFACATPAVASDIPGYAAVATPEVAMLVPPSDPDALSAAVVDLLSDENRRVEMGRAARAHALANYGWDDIARRLEETYVEVTA